MAFCDAVGGQHQGNGSPLCETKHSLATRGVVLGESKL